MRQRIAHADSAVETEVVVLWLPYRVAGSHADRRVVEDRRGGEGLLPSLRIHRRDIDERFEE